MLRRLLLTAVAMMGLPLAAMLAPGTANAAPTAACTGGVAVSQFAFSPASVPLGSSSPLTLVLQNCTSQTIQGSTSWSGTYTGQGCPVIDGILNPYTIAAGGSYTLTNSYGDGGFPGCQPTALRITASVNVNGAGTVTTATATLQFTAACTDGIAVTQFSFSPAAIAPGQTSTLTLVLRNCTSQTIQGSTVWFGVYTGQGGQHCLTIDPLPGTPYTIAPGGTYTLTNSYEDFPGDTCSTVLNVTANVSENGVTGTVTSVTAPLAITQPATGGCHVTYTPNNWQGGFTASVTIANNGSTAINGWTLTFTFPGDQKITNAWNATVTQTGTTVTAANMSYNTAIPAGGSQSFGFQGTWSANDTSPASFSLNGAACT